VAVAGWQCGSGSGRVAVWQWQWIVDSWCEIVRIYGNMAVFGVKMMPKRSGIA
jgi:hypothetical protein